MIDTYLADENAKTTIKEALDLIKPFYMSQMKNMMDEKADSLVNELVIPETHGIVMNYFYMHKFYPDFSSSPIFEKMMGYNKKADNLRLAYEAMPELNPRTKRRELLATFIEPDGTEELPIE